MSAGVNVDAIAGAIERYLAERTVRGSRLSGRAALDRDADLRRAGVIDSLNLVDLVLFAESQFGMRVPTSLLSDGRRLSINALAAAIADRSCRAESSSKASGAAGGRALHIAHAGACTLQETVAIGARAGGYRGFLSLLREAAGADLQLCITAHPRLRWDEMMVGALDGILASDGIPPDLRDLLERRRFEPQRFAGSDVVLLDVVHESYLWRIRWGTRGRGSDGEALPETVLTGMSEPARVWLNTFGAADPPIGLEELEAAMTAAIGAIRECTRAPIMLTVGLWHRPRTHFTTEYTGSSFDSALRRYLLSNALSSPDAFYARLAAIDSVARRVARRLDVAVVEGRDALAEAGQAAFADPIHLNDLGWDLLARALLRAMQSMGVIGRASSIRAQPSGESFRSLGARAALAVEQVKSADVSSHAVQDVFALPVHVLRLSAQFQATLADLEQRIRCSESRTVLLWGLGAIGDLLAQRIAGQGRRARAWNGPFLADCADAEDGHPVLVAGLREGAFGREWVRAQFAGDASEIEFVDVSDLPVAFAPGVEGAAEVRERHRGVVEVVRHVSEASEDVACVILAGDPAMARRALRLAGTLRVKACICDDTSLTHAEAAGRDTTVVLCCATAKAAAELEARLDKVKRGGVTLVNPDTAWLLPAREVRAGSNEDTLSDRKAAASRSVAGAA